MKIIPVDDFLQFMIYAYIKNNVNYNKYSELFLNSWTLFTRNYITMNELASSLDLMNLNTITIDIPDKGT